MTVASYSHAPSTLIFPFICLLWPCPLQLRLRSTVCDLPLAQHSWWGSGPCELMHKHVSSEQVRYWLNVGIVLVLYLPLSHVRKAPAHSAPRACPALSFDLFSEAAHGVRTCATRYCTLVQCQVDLCSTLAPSRRRHFWHFVQHACLTACGTCNVDTIHLIGIALLCGHICRV